MTIVAKCVDCQEPLQRISFIRRLRPGEKDNIERVRDPLCHPCWQADSLVVEASLTEK